MQEYDFCGWATRNNLKCADGRTIMKDAFAHQDGMIVPMVYQHNHDDVFQVLGHCLLKNDPEGVKAYGTFNDTEQGKIAKELVLHGDVDSLSIHANNLKQTNKKEVLHGDIKEVSLVLAGANPGAHITNILIHSEESGDYELENEAVLYTGESLTLTHADNNENENSDDENKDVKEKDMADSEKTVQDVLDEMTEEQKKVIEYLVGAAIQEAEKNAGNENEGEGENMKHSIFDQTNANNNEELMHDAMQTIIADGKRYGSLKESFLEHTAEYGIDNIDYLFPDAKAVTNTPVYIDRDQSWVAKVMNGVHHTPFSRIKSVFADITADDARAKGYIKGGLKKNEVFTLLKRSTNPTTIYKKQKMDRDDVVDITDFDVVAWIKAEMRGKLDEEIARAILFGDGRLSSSDEKINEDNIRPVISDAALYTITKEVSNVAELIDGSVEAQINYQGSGNLVGFFRKSWVTRAMLTKDSLGYRLYKSRAELATAMNLSDIVDVPDAIVPTGYVGVALDLDDYNVGADKGGAVNMFDDFDLDYNQQKYLIETRCSGALVKPYSAIAFEIVTSTTAGGADATSDDEF